MQSKTAEKQYKETLASQISDEPEPQTLLEEVPEVVEPETQEPEPQPSPKKQRQKKTRSPPEPKPAPAESEEEADQVENATSESEEYVSPVPVRRKNSTLKKTPKRSGTKLARAETLPTPKPKGKREPRQEQESRQERDLTNTKEGRKGRKTSSVSRRDPEIDTREAPKKLSLGKNKWGNFEEPNTHIVFSKQLRKAIGVQDAKTGTVRKLSLEHVKMCMLNGWPVLDMDDSSEESSESSEYASSDELSSLVTEDSDVLGSDFTKTPPELT
jgi:hypothetical protein